MQLPQQRVFPFRQDSSFLYYFGQNRDGLVGVIDVDNDIETLVGDDIDIEDIVWFGSVACVHDLAEQVGVNSSVPMKSLKTICNDAMSKKRKIHFLPPIATTSSYKSLICSAFIPINRRRRLPWTLSRPW